MTDVKVLTVNFDLLTDETLYNLSTFKIFIYTSTYKYVLIIFCIDSLMDYYIEHYTRICVSKNARVIHAVNPITTIKTHNW